MSGSYYAAGLGNAALRIQNAVTGDPRWFSAQTTSTLDLAALGIAAEGLGVALGAHICPAGEGREVVQLTWLDGRDATGRFALRGLATNAGALTAALRQRVSGDQIGIYDGSSILQLASGGTLALTGSCAGLSIPLGAPVLAFRIARPAAPVQELARTEFRTVPCGRDARGLPMRGTLVESRIVRFTPDGVISPADPDAGWRAETMGTCIADAIVTARTTTTAGGASVALGAFADTAAESFKAVLEAQLRMDCATTTIASDIITKDGQGTVTRKIRDKRIDTCGRAEASSARAQTGDADATDRIDRRDLCEDAARSLTKPLLGIATGSYASVMAGQINVDRVLDNRARTSDASQLGERARWIGQDPVSCAKSETYVATCGRVPGAPPRASDFDAAPNKWNLSNVAYYYDNENWFNEVFNVCLFDCTYISGGWLATLNWSYFREQKHLHADSDTTKAEGGWSTTSWADRFASFTLNFVYRPWRVPKDSNQCRIRYKEIQLTCPLHFDPLNAGGWDPYTLPDTASFETTLIPGGTYGGHASLAYNSARMRGDTPGLVALIWKKCNIKGCDSWVETAGPGTEAYIKSWTYSDASSVGGEPTSVQTIMLDREPHMYDLVPAVTGAGPDGRLTFAQRDYLPNRGLHCGRIERRSFGSWPMLVLYWSCGGKGGCQLNGFWASTTVEEVVTREWYGDNAWTGSWSRPVVRAVANGITYGSVSEVPNPIVFGP